MPSQTMRFEDLLDAMPDALVGVDKSGVIRFVNHQAESLFGYLRDDVVGARIDKLVPEHVRKVHEVLRDGSHGAPRTRPLQTGLKLSGCRADGTRFPIDITFSPMDTADGSVMIATVRDMSERERTDAERDQMIRLSAVVEFSGEAIISTTLDSIINSWNPAAERLYGYSRAEIVGKSSRLLIPQDQTEQLNAILDKIRSNQSVENLQTVRVRKDRTMFPALLTVSPICDSSGTVIGASTIARDATAQNKMLEAAQLIEAVIDSSGEAITTSTLDGIITSWNPAAEKLYGYSQQEIVGTSGRRLSQPDRVDELRDALTRIGAGGPVESLETVHIRKDGSAFPIALTLSPLRDKNGAIVGASAITRDLTSQREASELSRAMIEASLDSMVSISPQGTITDANAATVKLTGVPREKLIGTSFSDYFTDPQKAEAIYQKVFTEGTAVDYPLALRRRDGKETLTEVLYNASVYRDASGSVIGAFAAARDVTKQILALREAAHQQAMQLDRLADLERFQRLTVGRELKMIELKKEIDFLKRKHPPTD
jgi:PAS domain S-box-containing protein